MTGKDDIQESDVTLTAGGLGGVVAITSKIIITLNTRIAIATISFNPVPESSPLLCSLCTLFCTIF